MNPRVDFTSAFPVNAKHSLITLFFLRIDKTIDHTTIARLWKVSSPHQLVCPHAAAVASRNSENVRDLLNPENQVSWDVGTCHYWRIQTLGTPHLLRAYGIY